jgi:sigma-B regulation protein RsbU (phosphoserine phosphatase)
VKTVLRSTAPPLGIDAETSYVAGAPVRLLPGDLLFLFTDGIVDVCSADQRPFGIDRALTLIRDRREESARQIVEQLLQAVRAHGVGAPFDDMTAVVLKVLA